MESLTKKESAELESKSTMLQVADILLLFVGLITVIGIIFLILMRKSDILIILFALMPLAGLFLYRIFLELSCRSLVSVLNLRAGYDLRLSNHQNLTLKIMNQTLLADILIFCSICIATILILGVINGIEAIIPSLGFLLWRIIIFHKLKKQPALDTINLPD